MLVKLFTAVSSRDGSWGAGRRDLPDTLAAEMIAAGFAEPIEAKQAPAEPAPKPPRKGKEKK